MKKNQEFLLKTGEIKKVNCVEVFLKKDNLTALKEKVIDGNYEAILIKYLGIFYN